MAMQISGGDDEAEVMSAINTTPLVDVMLVLLIIFLITIPVATHTIKVQLPIDRNQPSQTMQGNIVLAVTANGQIYYNTEAVSSRAALLEKLEKAAAMRPQPQIQIRGDQAAKYSRIGEIVATCQQAGLVHLDFITQQPKSN